MNAVYIIETRWREDWEQRILELALDGQQEYFRRINTEWHIVSYGDGGDAFLSLKHARYMATTFFVCSSVDTRIRNYLTDEIVEEFPGEPPPPKSKWQLGKELIHDRE